MIPAHFAYFIGTLLFFIPWTILYIHRKDLRREMLVMGFIAAIASFITAYFWTIDWWHPETITGTRIGIEDFLLGISQGGIAAVLYEEIFRRSLYKRTKKHDEGILLLIILTSALFLFLLYAIHISSFKACALALVIFCLLMFYLRRDLLISSLINGILMVIIVLPVYYILIYFSPGLVTKTYFLHSLSGILITGIPIEELVFYFLFGCMVALFYEYWQGLGLRRLRLVKVKK